MRLTRTAVCSLHGRICPLFDLTPEILFFDIVYSPRVPVEKLRVSHATPETILNMLVEREVDVIISGDIQDKFQNMFLDSDIDVIWGVTGEVQHVIGAYLKTTLYSGMGVVESLTKRTTSYGVLTCNKRRQWFLY